MAVTPPAASQSSFVARLEQAVRFYQSGRLVDADREGRRLLALEPNHVSVLTLLASIAQQQGERALAIELWSRAANAPLGEATHWNSLGRAFVDAGMIREAQSAFLEALRRDSSFAEAANNVGLTHQELGDFDQAVRFLREAIRLNPTYAVAHCNLGHVYRKCGQFPEAFGCFEAALRLDPYSALAANGLGITFQGLGEVAKADHYYREALRVEPNYADARNNLATALKEMGKFDEAVVQYREALKLAPHHPYAIYNLSQFAAEGRYRFDAEEMASVKEIISREIGSDLERSMLCFSIAAVFDAEGSYDDAFSYYRLANDLRKKIRAFDAQMHRELTGRIVKIFDAEYFREVAGWGDPSQTPIFVVGMPRTGSTLVEQILATDAHVYPAGELGEIPQMMARLTQARGHADLYATRMPLGSRDAAKEFSDRYLAHLAKISNDASRVTIKTLENFLHLGVIATLFPNARIIHCVRDPLDVCVSCYFQNFTTLDFSWDLDDIASYYQSYERLAAHWQKVLPIRMHEVKYEELVRHPEKVTRDLFAHCDLEWRPRCLRYFENKVPVQTASTVQVRKPLSPKSIGRWQRYRAHLGPLITALGRAVPEKIPDPCAVIPPLPQADNC